MGREKPKNLLFVCFANRNRSPTAARVCSQMLTERGYKVYSAFDCPRNYDYYIDSAGTHADDDKNQMTTDLGKQMNTIFALDELIKDILLTIFLVPEEKIYTLNIPDLFKEDDSTLVEMLKERLERFLPKPRKISR